MRATIGFVRYLSGYVEFCAQGGFPERFLNLCKLNGISLWNVKNDGVKVNACTSKREFELIDKPAENSGMTLKTLETKGIPYWAKRHRWRCGVLVGLVVAVCFVWYMSGFIWEVEIAQEDGVKMVNFTENLEKLGVKAGARRSKIDITAVQEELLEIYPQLSWVSLNIFGDKVLVEYTPATPAPEITDTTTPSNIVAKKSGKIVLMEGYSGTNEVKEGAYVSEGSLLISGVITNGDGSEVLSRARGKVFAETKNLFTAETAFKDELYVSNDLGVRYSVALFGLEIPLGFKPERQLVAETHVGLEVNSALLPVGVIRAEGIGLAEGTVKYTPVECDILNLIFCVKEKRSELKNANIKDVDFAKKQSDSGVSLNMTVVCVEDIALEKPVFVEEN